MPLVPYAVPLGQNVGVSPVLCKRPGRQIPLNVFFMLRVYFKSTPIWLHFPNFGSCPRAISMHSESHRNDNKMERCHSTPCHQAAQPRDFCRASSKGTVVGCGGYMPSFGSCTAWPGNPDLVSGLPAEGQLPDEHSLGSCIGDRFLTLARMYRNTESNPASGFCEGWAEIWLPV